MSTPNLLLSWVDVAHRIWKASLSMNETGMPAPPEGVVFAQTFWDRLLVGVAQHADEREIRGWLKRLFDPRWESNAEGEAILLEAQGDTLSRLPVDLEKLDQEEVKDWQESPFRPRFSPPTTVCFQRTLPPEPDPFPEGQPPVLAFHSFKGGVGRTLCAMATMLAYTRNGRKVLLVDADFEAPGISFLFKERKPETDFALADLLTMLHADPDPQGANALASAVAAMRNQVLGNAFVLPCFRNLEEYLSLEIRPEHLVASTAHPPFFLTDVLSRLGRALGVDLVIVDLRAGLSELSAPLILDPRVKRILVTNASGQSIQGTRYLIQTIGEVLKINRWSTGNLPALILNQLPGVMMPKQGEPGGNDYLNAIVESINETLIQAFPQRSTLLTEEGGDALTTENGLPILLTTVEEGISTACLSYNEPLAMLSGAWDDAMEIIRQSLVPDRLWETLQLWLPATREPEPIVPVSKKTSQPGGTLDDRRTRLRDFAGTLVTAEGTPENSAGLGLLPIHPLTHLCQDHVSKLPIVVSIGAKGAGKTYSCLNMVRSRQWNAFVGKVIPDLVCGVSAPMLPVLWSKNVDSAEMHDLQRTCGKLVGVQPDESGAHFELARKASLQGGDLYAWRDFWADAIARSLGVPDGVSQPFEHLVTDLRQNNRQVIALIDGLEETFPEFAVNPTQQIALRALLQELPNWLRTLPGTPVGLIIFVRQDMVVQAIPQNRTQFTDRFKNYALRWTWKEALELAAWVSDKSGASTQLWEKTFSSLTEAEQVDRLKPLWGYKLGGEDTNEAISNNWVLSVLSDLLGRIQARDVIRFLHLAAKDSVGNTKTMDRLLTPSAIKGAIRPCSQKKVEEIGEENAPLREVFGKIKERKERHAFSSPCTLEELASVGLSSTHVDLMEGNGIIFFDPKEKKYYFPEIFRNGLEIERAAGARPKVLSLIRQARSQVSSAI